MLATARAAVTFPIRTSWPVSLVPLMNCVTCRESRKGNEERADGAIGTTHYMSLQFIIEWRHWRIRHVTSSSDEIKAGEQQFHDVMDDLPDHCLRDWERTLG